MNICVFGDYNPDYNRNKVLLTGLASAGVTFTHVRLSSARPSQILHALRSVRAHEEEIDLVLVPFSLSRLWVPLLRLVTRRPVVWDVLFSRYDAIINDRKLASRLSIKALYHWCADWLSVRLASSIILDTNEHITYFMQTFGRGKEAYIKVLVGAEDPKEPTTILDSNN